MKAFANVLQERPPQQAGAVLLQQLKGGGTRKVESGPVLAKSLKPSDVTETESLQNQPLSPYFTEPLIATYCDTTMHCHTPNKYCPE